MFALGDSDEKTELIKGHDGLIAQFIDFPDWNQKNYALERLVCDLLNRHQGESIVKSITRRDIIRHSHPSL